MKTKSTQLEQWQPLLVLSACTTGTRGYPFAFLTSGPERGSAVWAVFAFLKAFSLQYALVGLKNEPCGPAVVCVTMQVCVRCLNYLNFHF